MSDYLNGLLEGKIDFEGQKLVEKLMYYVLTASTIASFITGFALQSLSLTFGTMGLSVVVLAVAIIPPWPAYRSHPVKWLPANAQSTAGEVHK
ncbi:microsomal signal peptidase 12 kDa subunit [Pleurotus eryngii]|uniref:Signal peptidase complex subunit 1 n=1 Tax=Pleurotus eryngii TaxID=5323 RepID=A0A9P6A272_PLEER|nr:microsomal signal peptidase 12 kDa subunit [Pleurotus eryngii]